MVGRLRSGGLAFAHGGDGRPTLPNLTVLCDMIKVSSMTWFMLLQSCTTVTHVVQSRAEAATQSRGYGTLGMGRP
nr:hypothetical protein CFP56_11340 [Quercus suber]